MPTLRKVFPWIETFHRAQGCLALAFALLHAILLPLSTGASKYFNYSFVAPDQKIFAILGQIQLAAMILTVTTAILWRLALLRTSWIYIHYLNYAIFLAIWIHSWNLGSDLQQSTYAKWLWIFYGISAAIAFTLRLVRLFGKPAMASATEPVEPLATTVAADDTMFVAVSKTTDISPNKPICANASGKELALFNINGEFFAIDNVCSHAGGSLCKGKLEGTAVVCPRHGAKFDVRNGAVISGPARVPQQSYTTRINGDTLEVNLVPPTTSTGDT